MSKGGFDMSFSWRKSLSIWIVGFLTFVAALNTIDAAVIWSINGIDSAVPVYILGDLIPAWRHISVTTYFWISLAATFILLGMATLQSLRKPPLGPEVHKMASRVEDEMVATRGALESTRISLFARIEDEKIARQNMIASVNESVGSVRKEMLDRLESHRTLLDNGLGDLSKRIEKLEAALILPTPKLRSQSRTEEVRGVDLRLAQDLKAMGITNVGELVLSDLKDVCARTSATPEIASRLQGRAQLLMIPCIDEMDAEMLLDVGITSKKALASQDVIELCRSLSVVATAYVADRKISESERPTLEEISTWIESAKL
jgi:hypothetical protein